jgi:uncharacterized small protein (DUF1192 family)
MPSSRGSHTSLPVVPGGPRAVAAELKARIETLEAELAQLEGVSAGHRADFERERDRCERLMAEVLKTTADLDGGPALFGRRPPERVDRLGIPAS